MDHQEPDKFVDVSGYVSVAVKALRQHVTQVDGEDIDTYWKHWRLHDGAKVGFQYAEAFKRFQLG